MRKSVLSKKSENVVNRVIAALEIKQNQKLYDQDTYATVTECGTTCCIAGWVVLNEFGTEKFNEKIALGDEFDFIYEAEPLLTLKDGRPANSANLFDIASCWEPKIFAEEYEKANTASKKVKVAIDRLEYFKAYGE